MNDGGTRRGFLANALMLAGLTASYATMGFYALRFLSPVRRVRKQRLFVGLADRVPPGGALPFRTPSGETLNVVRGAQGFLALSDVCPHLGCRVHWDAIEKQFICPCHDGHFSADGTPLSGPPADMGVRLSEYKVFERNGVVFLEWTRSA